MSDIEKLDALIVGTGQAGKPLAGALAEAGWNVAIIEKGRVGGTCVVDGCTPTKTMIASAQVAHLARRGADYGVETGPISVDMEVVRRRKRDIVDQWSEGSRKGMERHETLELIMGEARFVGPRRLEVELEDGGIRVLEAEHVFINAGGRARIPDVRGLDDVPYLTHASAMELGEVPEHLVILGGGFIGLEFGQMFRRFGAEVTVIESGDRLAKREDQDVAEALLEVLDGEGIAFRFGCTATAARVMSGGGVEVELSDGRDTIRGSHLLLAPGRVPNSDLLELDAAGIDTTERDFIAVNDRLETTAEGVWALGDINGGPPFTHVAYDDYRIVKENLLGDGGASREGRILPYTLFTDPQLGRVGLTESDARDQGYDVRVACLPMSRVARAIETDRTLGFMKAVVDADTDRILGAAILGIEGGEVATVIQMAMEADLPYTVLRDGMFSHPTLSESLNNLFMELES